MSEISMREKAGLLAYSPLAVGYLTGKYRNKNIPKNSRLDLFYENYPGGSGLMAGAVYGKIAGENAASHAVGNS